MSKKDIFGTSIFKSRAGEGGAISRRIYNLLIGLILLWGALFNYLITVTCADSIIEFANSDLLIYIILLVSYFVFAILGVILNVKSKKTFIRFIGFNLVVLPLGLFLCLLLKDFSPFPIAFSFCISSVYILLLTIFSFIFPKFFRRAWRSLLFTFIFFITSLFVAYFIFWIDITFIDAVIVCLFCFYIGFVFTRTQRIPSSYRNVVDSVCAFYIDIINLFVNIVRLFTRNN